MRPGDAGRCDRCLHSSGLLSSDYRLPLKLLSCLHPHHLYLLPGPSQDYRCGTHQPGRLLLGGQLWASPLTYAVSPQVLLCLPRRGAGPQASHQHQEVSGFDLAPLLLVIQGETLLVLWGPPRRENQQPAFARAQCLRPRPFSPFPFLLYSLSSSPPRVARSANKNLNFKFFLNETEFWIKNEYIFSLSMSKSLHGIYLYKKYLLFT